MAAPPLITYLRLFRQQLTTLLAPAAAGAGGSTRAKNLAVSLLLASLSLPLFAVVYLRYGDAMAASFCMAALSGVAASGLALHSLRRVALARTILTLTVFLLLLGLIYRIGGARSPSLIWLVICPMLASAGGGVREGLAWSVVVMLTMFGISQADAAGLFPPYVVSDIRAINLIGNVAFVALVAVFLLLYERNNAAALRKLGTAMETIQLMAISDELTGLYNRRELLRIAHHEKLRADRYAVPLSYCLLDIDHFKMVNDTWGHFKGDEVLRGVARTLESLVRATDSVGRYGGEEFVFILSETDQNGALEFAERVRQAIERVSFDQLDGHHVTLSIGVAQDLPSQSVEQALARADAALYEAKRAGRNRVALGKFCEAA